MAMRQHGKRGGAVGHVGRGLEMAGGKRRAARQQRQIVEQHVAQGPPSGARRIGAEAAFVGKAVVERREQLAVRLGDRDAPAPRGRRGWRRDRCSCRSRGRCRLRPAASAPAPGRPARASRRRRSLPASSVSSRRELRLLAAKDLAEGRDQRLGQQRVEGLPAREGIAVMAGEEELVVGASARPTSVTGAEKPRLSDTAGRSATPEKRTTWRRLRTWMTPFSTLAPSTPS